jgi:hypothetical protein
LKKTIEVFESEESSNESAKIKVTSLKSQIQKDFDLKEKISHLISESGEPVDQTSPLDSQLSKLVHHFKSSNATIVESKTKITSLEG